MKLVICLFGSIDGLTITSNDSMVVEPVSGSAKSASLTQLHLSADAMDGLLTVFSALGKSCCLILSTSVVHKDIQTQTAMTQAMLLQLACRITANRKFAASSSTSGDSNESQEVDTQMRTIVRHLFSMQRGDSEHSSTSSTAAAAAASSAACLSTSCQPLIDFAQHITPTTEEEATAPILSQLSFLAMCKALTNVLSNGVLTTKAEAKTLFVQIFDEIVGRCGDADTRIRLYALQVDIYIPMY